eukprot:m.94854 g.94854  ORF g.94854 m.94854 type:complete len:433 (-) comp15427_c0_seq2:204-1502(-)
MATAVVAAGTSSPSPLPVGEQDGSEQQQQQQQAQRACVGFGAVQQEQILLTELKLVSTNAVPGVYVRGALSSFLAWDGVIFVRSGPYRDGVFKFRILIPDDYPSETVPRIIMQSQVHHPQVDPQTGELNLSSVFPVWNPREDRLWKLLRQLRHAFQKVDPSNPVNKVAAEQVLHDEGTFRGAAVGCVKASEETLYQNTSNCIKFHPWSEEMYEGAMSMVKSWNSSRGNDVEPPKTDARAPARAGTASDAPSLSPSRNLLRKLRAPSAGKPAPSAAAGAELAVRHVAKELTSNFSVADKLKKLDLRAHVKKSMADVVESSQDVELTDSVCKSFLSALDPGSKNWVNRWVALSTNDMLMRLYDEEKRRSLNEDDETINIVTIVKILVPDSSEHASNNTFMIVTPRRVHEFRAKSKAMLMLWTEVLNYLITHVSS